jgi:hypothetical protein
LAAMAGVLIASYLSWLEQYSLNKILSDGRPRIVLAEDPIDRSGFRFDVPIEKTSPPRFKTLIYTALRLRVGNQPVVNTKDAHTRVNAIASFFNDRGERLCIMDGRWADSPQPNQRDPAQDYVDSLSSPFPPGAFRSLDLLFIRPNETHLHCVQQRQLRISVFGSTRAKTYRNRYGRRGDERNEREEQAHL